MRINDILTPERVLCGTSVGNKTTALEILGELLSRGATGVSKTTACNSLWARERLGTTGFGHGVAIPHGRIKEISAAVAACVRLEHSIDFDAVDHQPVDLLVGFLIPEEAIEDHLQLLALLAERLGDASLRERLHTAAGSAELHALLIRDPGTPTPPAR